MRQKMYTFAKDNGDGSFTVQVFKTEKERDNHTNGLHGHIYLNENLFELENIILEVKDGMIQSFSFSPNIILEDSEEIIGAG